jgi:TolB protein
MRARRSTIALVGLGLMVMAGATPVHATVPGPNGLIAFVAVTAGNSQVYTINPDTLAQVQLTHLNGDAFATHWSPNSRLIAFEFDTDANCANVVVMNSDGTGMVVLPHANGDICEGSPSFSPDGTRIFFEGFNGVRDAIWSMNLDGSDRHWITSCEGRGVTAPEVSPDGEMLAFTCYQRSGSALFDASIDGSHLRQLTPFSFNVGVKEDWSPDSGRIMFISQQNEGAPNAQTNTATIRPDGTGLFWVTNYPAGGLESFGNSYSPDGQWILMRIEDHSVSPFVSALYKVHPDGSGLTQVTAFSTFRPRFMAWGSAT